MSALVYTQTNSYTHLHIHLHTFTYTYTRRLTLTMLCSAKVYWIFAVERQQRVVAKDYNSRYLSIPVESHFRFQQQKRDTHARKSSDSYLHLSSKEQSVTSRRLIVTANSDEFMKRGPKSKIRAPTYAPAQGRGHKTSIYKT